MEGWGVVVAILALLGAAVSIVNMVLDDWRFDDAVRRRALAREQEGQ